MIMKPILTTDHQVSISLVYDWASSIGKTAAQFRFTVQNS